jgi:RND family efflux transporter MFP subunit
MKHIVLKSILLAAIVALVSGCSEEPAEVKAIRPIKSAVVQVRSIGETVSQTGEVRSRYETPMSFRLDGLLTFRLDNGAVVKKGDILATIDKVPSRNNVLTARAELATTESALELARLTAERNRELFKKNAISRAQLQEAKANLRTAEARFEAAATALSTAEETLTYTEIKAPRDGVISNVGAAVGQVVQVGQQVVTLISDRDRDAVFDVPEGLLNRGEGVSDVKISLISDPSVTSEGKVREVTPSADPVTRTFRVKVTLDEQGRRMPFGAAVIGAIVLSPKKLVELPSASLTNNKGAPAVFVFDKETGKLAYRAVTVERYDDNAIYVSSGLKDGEIVATAGVSKLRDGEVVKLGSGEDE